MLVTIGPTMLGLIHSINPAVNIGNATHLFDIAWMYGVSATANGPDMECL